MEKIFRKLTAGFLSIFLMSMMFVSAGIYPTPFVSNNEADVAIVYGANAAVTDSTAAEKLVNSLANKIITPEELERILSAGVSEDEVKLGSIITSEGRIRAKLTDNKIPSLFDGKIYWHDGDSSHSYNVHEEILIGEDGELRLETTLDNNDFEGVVLTNDRALEYRYVFEETIDLTSGEEDAEDLEVVILGKEYSIEEFDGDTIIITQAEKAILEEGISITVEGKTLTIDNVYENSVIINGVVVKIGKRKTINGVEVKVEYIYFRDSDTRPSKVELYYGGDISKEYSDGDAFIGEDDDDPEWVWSIKDAGLEDGYIGVRYDLRQVDEDDDVVYEGEEYTFPNDFATVRFDSLTEVDYYDYEVFFDDVDLYVKVGNDKNKRIGDNVDVVVIKGDEDDSFELADGTETDTLYLELTANGIVKFYYRDVAEDYSNGKAILYEDFNLETISTLDLTSKNSTWDADGRMTATVEYTTEGPVFETTVINSVGFTLADYKLIYYADNVDRFNNVAQAVDVEDIDSSLPYEGDENAVGGSYDYTESDGYVHANGAKLWLIPKNATDSDGTINNWSRMDEFLFETDMITYTETPFDQEIATLFADETEMKVGITGGSKIILSIGDVTVSLGVNENGDFAYLGTEEEEAESGDVKVDGEPIGNKDNDVMDYYGTIIEDPEDNADNDKVVLRIPSERVYAQISVLGSEEDDAVVVNDLTPAELNITKVTDGQVATASGKNLIVVGGSCVNILAAELLGGSFCGADFTTNTGVSAGHFMIQTFDRGDGNVATLVAGYNAVDTVRGVEYLLNNNLNIAVGEKIII